MSFREGKDYGWPWCYGKQVHDGQFDKAGAKKEFCLQTEPSFDGSTGAFGASGTGLYSC